MKHKKDKLCRKKGKINNTSEKNTLILWKISNLIKQKQKRNNKSSRGFLVSSKKQTKQSKGLCLTISIDLSYPMLDRVGVNCEIVLQSRVQCRIQ